MSEFYKRKRNQILKDYKYLGIGKRIIFLVFRSLVVISLIEFIHIWLDMMERGDIGGSLSEIGICLVSVIICYIISNIYKKEDHEIKENAINEFMKGQDINISVVQKLIAEIEEYNKKVKVFASWISGLAATFLVLLITVVTNYVYKIFDMLASVSPATEFLEEFEREMNGEFMRKFMEGKFWAETVKTSLVILLLLCIVILIIYSVFSIFTFVKKQILIFLYDVQYKMLSKVSEGHKDVEIQDVGENQNEFGT